MSTFIAKPVSQADVAREAGVSASTVSLVLNGDQRVALRTRRRVRQIAERLGYDSTMNIEAQSLSARRTGRAVRYQALGLLWPSPQEPIVGHSFHRLVLEGILAACWEHDQVLTILNANWDESRNLSALSRVDGVIVPVAHPWALRMAQRLDKPMVAVLGDGPEAHGVSEIAVDHDRAIALAFAHLHELGHRRIGFLGARLQATVAARRWTAYCRELRHAGVAYDDAMVIEAPQDVAAAHRAFKERWPHIPAHRRPTSLIVYNDEMAMGALDAAHELGVDVPGELSLVSIDGIPEAAQTVPPLTTVAIDIQSIGRQAVRHLVEVAGDASVPPRQLQVGIELIVRGSTAAPGADPASDCASESGGASPAPE